MNVSNTVLWFVQGLLALFFVGAGAPKLLGRGMERWTGFKDLPRGQVLFIGGAEILGAAGLLLPMASGVAAWLTPLAACGLALIVLLAAGFHLRADERLEALETALWASVGIGIAVGRWDLLAARFDVSRSALVAAMGVLVPAAILNVIVLIRRDTRSA